MRFCKLCVMPDTRPGIQFNEEGICYPCLNAEKKKTIDWGKRAQELTKLCQYYRHWYNGNYDCLIPVSGGKDSHVQVFEMKESHNMNPLLVNVNNFSWTKTGKANLENLKSHFSCDLLQLHLNPVIARKMMRKAFEDYGSPTWYWDRAVYTWPLQIAAQMQIPLIVYGENISYEYGGPGAIESFSAKNQIKNNVVKDIDLESWGIPLNQLNPCIPFDTISLDPIYLSYFIKWSGSDNADRARLWGFKTLDDTGEWTREGYIEQYDQIDAPGYLVHPWMKYPKFGHARTTDVASGLIREGKLTRKDAIELVREHDHKLDSWTLDDFCQFLGYSTDQFWAIMEKWYNREIFEKRRGKWELKEPIWKNQVYE